MDSEDHPRLARESTEGGGLGFRAKSTEPRRSGDALEILTEVSLLTGQASEAELPDVLTRIVEGARDISQLVSGVVSLANYSSNELFTLQVKGSGSSSAVHREVFAGLPRQDVPGGFLTPSAGTSFVPLAVGTRSVGFLSIASTEVLARSQENEKQLQALAVQGAMVIDRVEKLRETREISHAFADILKASRALSSAEEVENLLKVIAKSARTVSGADFVVLYEYFEDRKDVRVPPVCAGELLDRKVMEGRGTVIEHRRSAVFSVVNRSSPFYAPHGVDDWKEQGMLETEAADERTFFTRENVLSSAGIPLRVDAECVGALFFNYRTEESFPPDVQKRLKLFADQAALAIGNARFFQRSEQYSQKLKLLQDIGKELSSAVNLDSRQILLAIDEQTRRVIDATNFLLCLYDQASGQLTLPYLRDMKDGHEALLRGLNEGLAAYICRNGRPILLREKEIEDLIGKGEIALVGTPAKVWLGAPMIARERLLGVVVIQDYQDEQAFGPRDLELLCVIASQAAIAIDNHQLFEDRERQVAELSALLKLSQEIGAEKLALTPLLDSVLDQACSLADCDESLLAVKEPGGGGQLRVIAASRNLQHVKGKVSQPGEGLVGLVVDSKKPRIIADYPAWEGRLETFRDGPPARVCGVPLLWKDEALGAVTLASREKQGAFSDRDLKLLQRFAGPLAIAIQNAHDSSFRRSLVKTGPHAIVAVDTEGRITELSDAAERLFQYGREDLIGEKVRKLYFGEQKDRAHLATELQSTGRFDGVIFGLSKEGEKIPIAVSASLLRDEGGEVLGSMGIIEDLRIGSLRGRTRELVNAFVKISQVEELDEAFELIVLHAITLLYGDAGCFFSLVGDSFEVRTSVGEDAGALAALGGPSAQKSIRELTRRGRDPKPLPIGAIRLSNRSVSAIAAPLRAEDQLLGLLWIESDQASHFREDQELLQLLVAQAAQAIRRLQLQKETAELQAEREKTLQQLLISSNAISVGQIATSFLHETRNSLTGTALSVSNLRQDLSREPHLKTKKDYLEQLEEIRSELTRIDALARRLQGVTQQRLNASKREIYLNDVVGSALELLESTLRPKKLKCEQRLDSGLNRPEEGKGRGHPVLADEDQIQQVLMNLFLNAIAASPARGRLFVETFNLPEQVEFRLSDQGKGISETDRKKIFEPFFTTKPDGTGLGLYISKILVENHQGRIEVYSSPGKGTVFSVILPREIRGGK